jgi:hypothetical protein
MICNPTYHKMLMYKIRSSAVQKELHTKCAVMISVIINKENNVFKEVWTHGLHWTGTLHSFPFTNMASIFKSSNMWKLYNLEKCAQVRNYVQSNVTSLCDIKLCFPPILQTNTLNKAAVSEFPVHSTCCHKQDSFISSCPSCRCK